MVRLGVEMDSWDYVVALAGNPNTGKSTVFNALTGLRQHTGNWPGKTVTRAEGGFEFGDSRFKLIDLPGTYSLLSSSYDEEIARDFILFGSPDVTVIVVDATRLERNLNLALQVLEITDRAVVCLNLMDEARRHGIEIDVRSLSRELGVPVVATSARFGQGLQELNQAIAQVASGEFVCRPRRVGGRPRPLRRAVERLSELVAVAAPGLPNAQWIALRLLDGDERIVEAVRGGELAGLRPPDAAEAGGEAPADAAGTLLDEASRLRWQIGSGSHQALVETIYAEAARIADRVSAREGRTRALHFEQMIDRLITSRIFGFPLMLLMLAVVFWATIAGANVPSSMLATLLLDTIHPFLKGLSASAGLPWWLDGLLLDGIYLGTAWVIAVMLPPMAIFFPIFTLLEDLGYLPRVAFNLDKMFQRVGAHGRQALTMAMGFGCNAAGVVATRIIDSPRERLIAIITNNFALCNGRWPTQIMIATIFIGSLAPPYLAGFVSAAAVVSVAVLGILLTFLVSWGLSRTVLRGEVSTFSLELPPYRPPRLLQTLYTSLIDRTLIVLGRAVLFAIPAGALIWTLSNVHAGDASLAQHLVQSLDPFGMLIGLSGVILVAYVLAIPANEIVIPTVLMLTVLTSGMSDVGEGAGVMFELDSVSAMGGVLRDGGWTLLMGVNLMLFSLVHNPCSTTIYTIWKETKSARWTAVSALLPLVMGFVLCFLVAQIWRIAAG
ncbi:iron transporter FeoB [Acidobacteria bacterium Mor1]|nr:iron transporter FeoB [Acidobacteria bacterium Mor1]